MINGGKELVYEKNYSKIDVNANDVPLYKPLEFQTLLTVIRCVFQTDNKLEPQVYLDECLYEYEMLEYEKKMIFQMELILISQINQKNICSVTVGIFLDKSFSYGPYLCDGCYNMMQKCNKLKNIAIIHIKESVYRFLFCL